MNGPEKPKIIVDEDWKSQVQEEREQLKQQVQGGSPPGSDSRDDPVLPAPSLSWLITSLATQALAAMGQLPDPLDGQIVRRPNLARHHIDTLSLLQDKTQGNLSHEESRMLEDVLHQLRMAFVAASSESSSADV
jgi:hypothetical protein